jgi:hypothetical protein
MTKRRKGYSYLRYSSPKQTLGDSERRQIAPTAEYAAELGIELDETLIDRGLSGYHGKHRAGPLGRFVERVERGEIDRGGVAVGVKSVDAKPHPSW